MKKMKLPLIKEYGPKMHPRYWVGGKGYDSLAEAEKHGVVPIARRMEIQSVRVSVMLDIPVVGNNGEPCRNDEEAQEVAADYGMPDTYVPDSVEFVKVIRG